VIAARQMASGERSSPKETRTACAVRVSLQVSVVDHR